jgi:hypothetical protein
VGRSAQDDDFVGALTRNIPNKLALMGLCPGLHPDLDVDLYVPALIERVMGTGAWLNSAARAAVLRLRRNAGHPGRMGLRVEGHGTKQ